MEDRKQFVQLLDAVRDAAEEEAGSLSWASCVINVMKIGGVFCVSEDGPFTNE